MAKRFLISPTYATTVPCKIIFLFSYISLSSFAGFEKRTLSVEDNEMLGVYHVPWILSLQYSVHWVVEFHVK